MTSSRVVIISIMALVGLLLGLCWRDPLWAFVAIPVLVPLLGFAVNVGERGQSVRDAAGEALRVGLILAIISAAIFVFARIA